MTVLYDMRKRRCIRTLLFVGIFIFTFGTFSSNKAEAAASKTLNINWPHIASVGNQAKNSVSCFCFALAYCRTILDGRVHSWSEYDNNGGTDQYNASAVCDRANYYQHKVGATSAKKKEIYKAIYDSINVGRPVIVHVKGRRASYHWIALVGYINVTSTDSLSASNFLMIDSVIGTSKSNTENMGSCGYDLNGDNGYYYYCTTNLGSVGPQDKEKPTITNAKVTNITKNGYTVTCNVSDNVGVTKVLMPTWTVNNGQDDLPPVAEWPKATINGNTATYTVSRADHNNESGTYVTDIYAYDAAGNASEYVRFTVTLSDQAEQSFDFIDLKDNDIINGKRTIKLKQTGYGNCELEINIGGLIISEIKSDKNGIFSVELDLSKWQNGSYVLKAILHCADGTNKTIKRTINVQNIHVHSYTRVIEKNATCGAEGLSYEKCSTCGEKKAGSEKTIPATGKHVKDTTIPPGIGWHNYGNCVYADVNTYKCAVCGAKIEEIGEKYTDHKMYVQAVGREATCGEEGYYCQKCAVCGIEKSDSRVVIPATGNHTYIKVTTIAPTCGASGEQCEKCSVCGAIKEGSQSTIPATGMHRFGEWKIVKQATATEEGSKQRICSVCGEIDTDVVAKLAVSMSDKTSGEESLDAKTSTETLKTVTIKLNKKKKVTLKKDQKLQVKVKGVSKKKRVTFKSSNKKIATVSAKGIIKAKKAGKTTITVKCGKKKARITIKVKK